MSRAELTGLDDVLRELLDGSGLDAKVGTTILLLTVSENGFPHVAMLSVGELVAVDSRHLRLALWPDTETGRNIQRTGVATFSLVERTAGYTIEADMSPAGDLDLPEGPLDLFVGTVRRVLVDVADYATLTSGITFSLPDAPAVVERWRRTVAALIDR